MEQGLKALRPKDYSNLNLELLWLNSGTLVFKYQSKYVFKSNPDQLHTGLSVTLAD